MLWGKLCPDVFITYLLYYIILLGQQVCLRFKNQHIQLKVFVWLNLTQLQLTLKKNNVTFDNLLNALTGMITNDYFKLSLSVFSQYMKKKDPKKKKKVLSSSV